MTRATSFSTRRCRFENCRPG